MDTMGLNGKFLITDTSFGNIVLENGYQDDHPISMAIATAEDFEIQTTINNVNNAIRELQRELDEQFVAFNQYNMTQLTDKSFHSVHASLNGWQLNGKYFCNDKKNVNTVKDLLVYFLTENSNEFIKLSRFHQLIIIELIGRYIPEKIVEHTDKFEKMKSNNMIEQAYS